MNDQSVTLESEQLFSESLLWHLQREFYESKGSDAWVDDVPFYITSNVFIATLYANIIMRFIQEWITQHPDSKDHPFNIVELGTGSGQLSFHVVQAIKKIQTELNLDTIKILYIITDYSQSTIDSWKSQPQLSPLIETKQIDVALFDITKDTTIVPQMHSPTLCNGNVHNPLIVVANYFFDSIQTELFHIQQNRLSTCKVSLQTPQSNLEDGQPVTWNKINLSHTLHPLPENAVYSDPTLNHLLNSYAKTIDEGFLLFPAASLEGLSRLRAISDNKILLLTSDKAYTQLTELEEQAFPDIDFHGSFSLMVNFHAFKEYFDYHHGSSFIPHHQDTLTSAVFLSGIDLNTLPETRFAIQSALDYCSPSAFFSLYEYFEDSNNQTDLSALSSLLSLSGWDTGVFSTLSTSLTTLLADSDTDNANLILDNLHKLSENFYYLPDCNDIFYSMGIIYYNADRYDQALRCYHLSKQYFGDHPDLTYNMGLCYYYAKNQEMARHYLSEALITNSENTNNIQPLLKQLDNEP